MKMILILCKMDAHRGWPAHPGMSDQRVIVKYMFDTYPASRAAATPSADSPAAGSPVPLERLEAQICELAGHLAAATCRFLVLLADFDARQGWASWEMTSCAAWLTGN